MLFRRVKKPKRVLRAAEEEIYRPKGPAPSRRPHKPLELAEVKEERPPEGEQPPKLEEVEVQTPAEVPAEKVAPEPEVSKPVEAPQPAQGRVGEPEAEVVAEELEVAEPEVSKGTLAERSIAEALATDSALEELRRRLEAKPELELPAAPKLVKKPSARRAVVKLAKRAKAVRVRKRPLPRKRKPSAEKPRAKRGARVVKKPSPVEGKVRPVKKSSAARVARPAALKPIEGPRLEVAARSAAPKPVSRPRAKLVKPSKKLARAAAAPGARAIEAGKLPLQAIASDFALEELKRKLEAKQEVEALREFEEYTTFEPPKGYKELERYWVVKPYAWAAILFNEEKNERLYYLVEPTLTPLEKTILETLHEHLLDRLTYETGKERDAVIREKALELLDEYGLSLDDKSVNKIIYYLRRNYVGYGRIDGLLRDPRIEDISCDGVDVPIFLYHRDHQNIRTNIVFEDAQELDLFVIRLVERAGRQISLGRPTVDAALPEGYRLQATIGTEITTRGSSFSIRKYTEEPFTPVDLILYGTFSPEMLAYLWLATENKRNVMIVGGTASGKTCTLNALSLFIPPDAKIISIEDTRELTLYQDNWLASVTRDAHGERAIDMYDLLRQALRQRPEVIIVGEVRGKEALTLFQAMSTGHSCYSTMHAGSIQEMVHRLEGEPINVPHHMLTALDIVCLQLLTYHRDRRVRRNQSIVEVLGVDPVSGALRTNRIYERNPITDEFERVGNSQVLLEIAHERGWSAVELERELDNRKKVLEYLARKNMRRISEVSTIIRQYYFDPAKVMELVERGG